MPWIICVIFPVKVTVCLSFAEFVQILSRSHLKMRVWERGAGMLSTFHD
jgi:diaminopimelate epimerase